MANASSSSSSSSLKKLVPSEGMWTATLPGNSSTVVKPGYALFIRNAAITYDLNDRTNAALSELFLEYVPAGAKHPVKVLLWTFRIYFAEQANLLIDFNRGESYKFIVVGENHVDVIGYFDDVIDGAHSEPTIVETTFEKKSQGIVIAEAKTVTRSAR